jgi:hypothetical protein
MLYVAATVWTTAVSGVMFNRFSNSELTKLLSQLDSS